MKRFVIICTAAALWLIASAAHAGTISGSAHDFSGNGWANGEVCVVCHTPHTAPGADGPLWNRADYDAVAVNFTMYPDTNLDGTTDADPTGDSVICLSCHEGTLAIDSFGGATGTILIGSLNSAADLDTDLSDDHPVSLTYNTADAELRGTGDAVSFANGTDSGTVADMLQGGKVQCSSCHDVHNTQAGNWSNNYLLRVANDSTNGTASGLCIACHAK
jgi:hypothetical protein